MLKAKQLPNVFHGVAVITAAFILNTCVTQSVDDMKPFQAFF
jgi:hypothetical protein